MVVGHPPSVCPTVLCPTNTTTVSLLLMWMRAQWALQKQILQRYRALGIVGQLPAFQGNVPVGLKAIKHDANITAQGSTGWLDALDPARPFLFLLLLRVILSGRRAPIRLHAPIPIARANPHRACQSPSRVPFPIARVRMHVC